MIKEMINNMLGEYSKFIQIQDDGTVKVFVPEDVNNPSMKNATELTLSKDVNKWIKLALGTIKK